MLFTAPARNNIYSTYISRSCERVILRLSTGYKTDKGTFLKLFVIFFKFFAIILYDNIDCLLRMTIYLKMR